MTDGLLEPTAPRILPPIDDVNRSFWEGGRDGRLHLQRCDACDRWVHPPTGSCPTCGGPLVAAPVSGRGSVLTFTINEHQYHPAVPPPYVIAIVQLDEQDDLRLPTNIVGCDPGAVRCGMPVRVCFERNGDTYVPLFTPD